MLEALADSIVSLRSISGGGNKINENLSVGDVPTLWMANEAIMAGLVLTAAKVEWDWDNVWKDQPFESLRGFWLPLEWLPVKRPRNGNPQGNTWCVSCKVHYSISIFLFRRPHRGKGRVIREGQKIHASVAFKNGYRYTPQAISPEGFPSWYRIVGTGQMDDIAWAKDLNDIIEMDLFDFTEAGSMMTQLKNPASTDRAYILERLARLAPYGTSPFTGITFEVEAFVKTVRAGGRGDHECRQRFQSHQRCRYG
jgi:hypothetical protein